MKILIIGSNGQLGSDLMNIFSEGNNVLGLNHEQIEITNIDIVRNVLFGFKPEIVLNTAAFHNLPVCEANPIKSFEINAIGSYNLAKICFELGCILVHYSTDYVFDGIKKSPYLETDNPNPLNIYGLSKFSGEQLIKMYLDKHIIIRISGIYGKVPCRAKGGNFIYNIVKASKEKKELKVVNDEILTPTPTIAIASNTLLLLSNGAFGTYHMTSEGQCSWYDFTKTIFDRLKIQTPLFPVSASEFPSSIKRPLYSVLENQNLRSQNINIMPFWEDALIKFLSENFD